MRDILKGRLAISESQADAGMSVVIGSRPLEAPPTVTIRAYATDGEDREFVVQPRQPNFAAVTHVGVGLSHTHLWAFVDAAAARTLAEALVASAAWLDKQSA